MSGLFVTLSVCSCAQCLVRAVPVLVLCCVCAPRECVELAPTLCLEARRQGGARVESRLRSSSSGGGGTASRGRETRVKAPPSLGETPPLLRLTHLTHLTPWPSDALNREAAQPHAAKSHAAGSLSGEFQDGDTIAITADMDALKLVLEVIEREREDSPVTVSIAVAPAA